MEDKMISLLEDGKSDPAVLGYPAVQKNLVQKEVALIDFTDSPSGNIKIRAIFGRSENTF